MNRLLSFLIATIFASQIVTIVLAMSLSDFGKGLLSATMSAGKKALKEIDFELEFTKDLPKNDSDVKFFCINRNSTLNEVKLNDSDVENKLNFSKPINFVIHGFVADMVPILEVAVAWIESVDCNVCIIDWRELSGHSISFDNFFKNAQQLFKYKDVAMHHTVTTSNAIHRFMEFLMKNKMKIDHVSMAGHSLGAHIAGFVGASFNGSMKAIYGLDPAGPGFQNKTKEKKLTKDDAQYVQCIYTDGNTWGTETKNGDGHGNFLMNGGLDQPGCEKDNTAVCDHSRAYKYFIESMNNTHIFEGKECNVQDNKNRMDRIGIYSKNETGTFCVKTNDKYPYAMKIISN